MTPPADRAAGREIAPDVYCVRLKGRTQTNVYLVASGPTWVVIDAGWSKDGPTIRRASEAVFGVGANPAAILLTHVHPDHSGSALELAGVWDCPVYLHPDELRQAYGDLAAIKTGAGPLDTWLILPLLRAMGRRRRDAILARSSLEPVARAFEPGTEVPGLAGWQWIHTPGHTPGHVSYFRPSDRVLITGDAVVTLQVNSASGLLLKRPGLSGPPWYTTWDRLAARKSIVALAALEPCVLAGGHGTPLADPATPAALRAFARRAAGQDTTPVPETHDGA